MKKTILAASLLILLACAGAQSHHQDGFQMEVLVSGSAAPKYFQSGKVYIEALKNQEYSIRLTNPLNRRVAVALAVDGLNSIDARTSDAFSAKKWVLGPYETITIDGWQVNQQQARKFFFTTEAKSYGQWLGKTQNLGIISAVFYRERPRWNQYPGSISSLPKEDSSERRSSNRDARQEAPQTSAGSASDSANPAAPAQKKTDDYAATGIGRRTATRCSVGEHGTGVNARGYHQFALRVSAGAGEYGHSARSPCSGHIVEKGTGTRIHELLPRTAVESRAGKGSQKQPQRRRGTESQLRNSSANEFERMRSLLNHSTVPDSRRIASRPPCLCGYLRIPANRND